MIRITSISTRAGVLLLLLSACREATEPAFPDLLAARSRWTAHRPASYEYTLSVNCFCIVRPMIITVAGTTVTAGRYVDDGTPVPNEQVAQLPSIDGLFDRLAEARLQHFAVADATFDPTVGYPLSIYLDHSFQIADEEIGYAVTNFVRR